MKFNSIEDLKFITKEEYIIFFCERKKKNIGENFLKQLILEEDNLDTIWKILILHKDEHLFNSIIILKFLYEFLDIESSNSKFEEKIYKNCKKEKFFVLVETLKIILENKINEMIKTDLDIIDKNEMILAIPMSSFYSIRLNHIKDLDNKNLTDIKKKIQDINIIFNSLERINETFFYTALSKKNNTSDDFNDDIKKIKFTKGYLFCMKPKIVKIVKNFKYTRKLISRDVTIIYKKKKDNLNTLEAFDNNNYSSPIWLENNSVIDLEMDKIKIYNREMLFQDSGIEKILESINYLNSVELSYDKKLFEKITELIENNSDIHITLTTKNTLKDNIYIINSDNNNEEITEKDINQSTLLSLIQSASINDLIKKQIAYYESFYISYRMDSRLRIYCNTWPISYQLNHIIRNVLIIKKQYEIDTVWDKFVKNKSIVKYLKNPWDIFENFKIGKYEEFDKINNIFKKIKHNSEIEKILKEEYLFILMCKLSPNNIKNIREKISFVDKNLEDFIKDDLCIEYKKWLDILKMKKKKIPYLLNIQKSIKDLKNNSFEQNFWGDASSNAIQLITLRLKIFKKEIMMLTNIIENETDYENIYEYLTDRIKKDNHSKIVKKLNNRISSEEINFLQEKDLNKYLIMPSSYGMGKKTYRKKIAGLLDNNKKIIWEKLLKKEQDMLSDYFWDKVNQELNLIGFNTEMYKKECSNFWKKNDCDVYVWENDIGVKISPINIIQNDRQKLLEKENFLKMNLKEEYEEEKKEVISEKIKKIKEKLKKNEKLYWKRSMVKTKKQDIFVRIYHQPKKKIDKNQTKQGLIPNTIHAYDASVLHLTIKICKEIDIEVLTVHDSIGCKALYAPIVKTVFKIANIIILEESFEKNKFPLEKNNFEINDDEKKLLFEKILKSSNFFR